MASVEPPRPRGRSDDCDLFDRQAATLRGGGRGYAACSPGAELVRVRGATAAGLPEDPERMFDNDAVLDQPLRHADTAAAAERDGAVS
jgi:hypothetical protein